MSLGSLADRFSRSRPRQTATLTIKGADGKKVPGKANEILQGILDFFIIDVKKCGPATLPDFCSGHNLSSADSPHGNR